MRTKWSGLLSVGIALPLLTLACAQPSMGQERNTAPGQQIPIDERVEPERANFRALLAGNPNYFGNLKVSDFKMVKKMSGNTKYEQIECVGFNPAVDLLEAVVVIKRPTGYGGGICSAGTPEFVRFYIRYGKSKWQDLGTSRFTAYDIPGTKFKPLEYAVRLKIEDPEKSACDVENLPVVRAILSWNKLPPPDEPDWLPVWGNVIDARIQMGTRLKLIWEMFKESGIMIPEDIKSLIDLKQVVSMKEPAALGAAELKELYGQLEISPMRYMHQELYKVCFQPGPDLEGLPGLEPGNLIPELLGDDAFSVIDEYLEKKFDTKYEELTCVGLDPNQPHALLGVVKVKLPYGYSGDLCKPGSVEYVAFWADWDATDAADVWEYVGTAAVKVHDIHAIPREGLHYAVFLPVDLTPHQQACRAGAPIAKIRAILSWNTKPPTYDPDWVAPWGNHHQTLVHIPPPTVLVKPGQRKSHLWSLSGVTTCKIDQTTGLTVSGDQPFGGWVDLGGFVTYPPDVNDPWELPLKYHLDVYEPSGPKQPLSNSFEITVIENTGSFEVEKSISQAVDADGWYTYQEDPDPAGNGYRLVHDRLLGHWQTHGLDNGEWYVQLRSRDHGAATDHGPATVLCEGAGTAPKIAKVFLDEVPPEVSIKITGYKRGGGPIELAKDCDTFQVGDVIHGVYTVTDEHFRTLTLTVKPSSAAGGATVDPSSRSYPLVPTTGETHKWELDTSSMDSCGFTVELKAWDRTIVNGNAVGWKGEASVGFCLVEASPKKPEKRK